MSELLKFDAKDVDSYQQFVSTVRDRNLGEDWKIQSAQYLSVEMVEALTQHGGSEAAVLFLPSSFIPDYDPKDISADTRFAIADELGDSLWFTVDCLDRGQSSISAACTEALCSFGIDGENSIRTFNDIQQIVINNADKICYLSKAGLVMGYGDIASAPKHLIATLPQNPLLHFTRTNRRLARALEEGKRDTAPYASGADFEPAGSISLAAGQHLLTLAWLAEARLGVSLNGIALFNHDKLVHRQSHGKENDIHFDATYAHL